MIRLLRLYFQLAGRWLRWYRRARTWQDLHAPAAFRFAKAVVQDDRSFYAFSRIETLRSFLLNDRTKIETVDYGAGSLVDAGAERTIADIARFTPVSPETGRRLFRLVNHYQPETVVELGSSLGISTAYLASARRRSKVFAVEGNPALGRQARRNWDWLGLDNIRLRTATFDEALPAILSEIDRLDLLFLDGDHRQEPSMRYFEQCLTKTHSGSIFIIADIHWSAGMEAAWAEMRAHPSVRLSIDLFQMGVLFFDPAIKMKQRYTLAPAWWKPWRLGLLGGG